VRPSGWSGGARVPLPKLVLQALEGVLRYEPSRPLQHRFEAALPYVTVCRHVVHPKAASNLFQVERLPLASGPLLCRRAALVGHGAQVSRGDGSPWSGGVEVLALKADGCNRVISMM